MKKQILVLLLIFIGIVSVFAVDVPVNISYYQSGVLTQPDSAIINMTFYPSLEDSTYIVFPTTAIWDTLFTIADLTDQYVIIKYMVTASNDSAWANERLRLRRDTSSFLNNYYSQVSQSVTDSIERVDGMLDLFAAFWGACDSCFSVYYPEDGTSPKDSVVIFDSLGVARGKITYFHSNVGAVLDSILFRKEYAL